MNNNLITRVVCLMSTSSVSWSMPSSQTYELLVKGHCLWFLKCYVIVRPLSTVGYTSVVASVIHSRQWSN